MNEQTVQVPLLENASEAASARAGVVSLRQRLLLMMLVGDLIVAYAGLALGYFLKFHSPLGAIGVPPSAEITFGSYQRVILLGLAFLLFAYFQQKIYNWKLLLRPRKLIPLTLKATGIWFLAYLCTFLVLKFEPEISRIFMLYSAISLMVLMTVWKTLFTRLMRASGAARALAQKVLFVGWNPESADLADAIYGDESHPYRVLGWIDTSTETRNTQTAPAIYAKLGLLETLEDAIRARRPDILIVADLNLSRPALARIAKLCEVHYVQLKVLPSMFQIFISGLRLESISSKPLLGVEEMAIQQITGQVLKRALDIAGGLFGLILSAPILAVCAFLIKREDPAGPIIYKQVRSGLKGKPFTIYKLRSMRVDAEADGGAQWAKPEDPRRLGIGKFMRETNIDELPQFWNVLKGDMSLVGPRPERPELIEKFETEIEHYNHRHHVKPGITGWAQIHGLRGDTDLSERIRYDVYYIENWSIWMDLYCLAMTFFTRKNAY
jgi:exopolysaccharide biosynthesis polyprenyl glycosylphosphotransferase